MLRRRTSQAQDGISGDVRGVAGMPYIRSAELRTVDAAGKSVQLVKLLRFNRDTGVCEYADALHACSGKYMCLCSGRSRTCKLGLLNNDCKACGTFDKMEEYCQHLYFCNFPLTKHSQSTAHKLAGWVTTPGDDR